MEIIFLNDLELIYLHTSIDVVFVWLYGFKYCDLTQKILFSIYHLFVYSQMVDFFGGHIKQYTLINAKYCSYIYIK